MKLKNPKAIGGFTLIEMIIVIAIIGILAGLVLRETFVFQASARDTRRIGDLKNTQNYLELYFNSCGQYPGDASCGTTDPTNWSGLQTVLSTKLGLSSAGTVPNDPLNGSDYYYCATGNHLSYTIAAKLETSNNVLNNQSKPSCVPSGVTTNSSGGCLAPYYCVSSQ